MEHGEEPSEFEHEDSEMNEDHHDCPHCGLLFSSNSTLHDHIEKCPNKPIPTSDIFGEFFNDEDEESEDAWVDLILHCNEKARDTFEKTKQEYIAAGESEKKAYSHAKRDLKPTFKEAMKRYVDNALVFVLKLKNSRFFEEILEDLLYFKKEKGLTWDKAVPAALDRNFDVFGKVLKAKDIGEQVRGEKEDTDSSAESDESMEDSEDESEEDAEKPIFP